MTQGVNGCRKVFLYTDCVESMRHTLLLSMQFMHSKCNQDLFCFCITFEYTVWIKRLLVDFNMYIFSNATNESTLFIFQFHWVFCFE